MARHKWLQMGVVALGLSLVAGMMPAYAISPNSQAVMVARVTGATPAGETLPNPNHTDANYQVMGTDLGIMWDKGNGQIFAAFGDTYGQGWGGSGAGPDTADWRSNVLAVSSDTNLSDGMTFDTMIQDYPGHAKELFPAKRINNDEWTVIPTAGVTVGSRHYIQYMSINHWGAAGGYWYTNYGGIAYSDDNGQNWTKDPNAKWYNDTTNWNNNFQQAAFVKNSGFVYMFATPNGRHGDVFLARVPENSVLDINAYRYWDGLGWVTDQNAARPVTIGAAGELSVVYNTYFHRFIMTYLNEDRASIVMRDAPTPIGPWSGEKPIVTSAAYPGLYGGFIHPWSANGTDMYIVMSQWGPYNTFLMKVPLTSDLLGDNIVSDPGFETQRSDTSTNAPWYWEGNGGIDRNLGNAHSGLNNAFVRYNSGWNATEQRIVVQPHTNYTMTGWVHTSSNNTDGYFGVRDPDSKSVISETKYGNLPNYTQLTVHFNSGNNTTVELYSGIWANNGDTWSQLDDVSVTKDANLVGVASFEAEPTSSLTSPWYGDGTNGVDRNLGFAHSGANNAWAHAASGWNSIKQEIFVEPNTNYTLTGWVQTSANNTDGYFGARQINGGPVINEVKFGNLPGYTQESVTFNSGSNYSVEIYAGMWSYNGDTWIRADDFSLTKN